MSGTTWLKLIVALIVGSVIIWWCAASIPCFVIPPMPKYHGDGIFEDESKRTGPFAYPAYGISMEDCDLGKPYTAEYRLSGLKTIKQLCGVHLAVRNPKWRFVETETLEGYLRLDVLDSKGKTVVSVAGRLGDFTWTVTETHEGDIQYLYRDECYFTPSYEERYRLLFSYEPDCKLVGNIGFVYVHSE